MAGKGRAGALTPQCSSPWAPSELTQLPGPNLLPQKFCRLPDKLRLAWVGTASSLSQVSGHFLATGCERIPSWLGLSVFPEKWVQGFWALLPASLPHCSLPASSCRQATRLNPCVLPGSFLSCWKLRPAFRGQGLPCTLSLTRWGLLRPSAIKFPLQQSWPSQVSEPLSGVF